MSEANNQTTEILNKVSTGSLPWAPVIMPPTSSGMNGVGMNKHSLQPEDMVIGYFLDDDMQQPVITGVFQGGSGSGMAGSPGGSGGSGGTDVGMHSVGEVGENGEKAYFLLLKYGYSNMNAGGIIGNLAAESGGNLDPNIVEKENNQTYKERGFGIAQWTSPDRKAGLRKHAGNKYNTLEGQVSYLVWELKNKEHAAEKGLANSRDDLAGSVIAFLEFERPKGYDFKLKRATGFGFNKSSEKFKTRYAFAQKFMQKMGNKTPPSETQQTPSSTPTPPTTTSTTA